MNGCLTIYFLIEMFLRVLTHRAFGENFKEFISSNILLKYMSYSLNLFLFSESFNVVDIIALTYSMLELILFYSGILFPNKVKILRMFIVLRLIRIFRFSKFSKGVNVKNNFLIIDNHHQNKQIFQRATSI